MSGILIDVSTRAGSTENTLQSIDRSLGNIDKNAGVASTSLQRLVAQAKLGNIKKEADTASGSMKTLGSTGSNAMTGIAAPAASATSAVNGLAKAAGALVATLAAMQGVSSFYKVSDELTGIQNKLRLVTKSTNELIATQQDLFIISQQTRTGFKETADVYFTLARSMEKIGESQNSLKNMSKTIQQTIAISGTTSESASAALLQLSQGLASGTLRGEELNSVMEQLPRLGQAITKSLGMNVGELRKFAEQGKLTTEVMVGILKDNAKEIDSEFALTAGKASDGFNKVVKSIKMFVGELNGLTGSSGNFYKRTSLISEGIDKAAESMQSSFYVMSQGLRNYIGNLNTYTTSALVLKRLNEQGISIFDIASAYRDYEQAKSMLSKIGLLRKKAEEPQTVQRPDIGGINTPELKAVKTFAESIKELGALAFSATYAFTGLFAKLPKLIPDIRGPVATFSNEMSNWISQSDSEFRLMATEVLLPFARKVEAVYETLNLFTAGDNALERAWVNVFRSDSIKSLTGNLRDLGEELRSLRFSDESTVWGDIKAFARSSVASFTDVLRYLDLVDNRLISIRNIRFDRLIQAFDTLGSVSKRVYTDVFSVPLNRALNAVYYRISLFTSAVADAIKDSFTTDAGEALALGLINLFKGIFQKDLLGDIFSGPGLLERLGAGLAAFGSKLAVIGGKVGEVAISVGRFIAAFVVTLFKEMSQSVGDSYVKMIDGVVGYSDKLLSAGLGKVKQFTDSVGKLFFNVYDAVVGHSYWPDLVDGVIAHTHRLGESLSGVKSFGNTVQTMFYDLQHTVLKGLEAVSGGAIKVPIRLDSSSFENIGGDLRKYISAAIIGGVAFALGGPKLRLFLIDAVRSTLTASAIASSSDFSAFLGQSLGEGLSVLTNLFVSTVQNGLNNIINGLPSFSEAFLSGLTGPIATALNSVASLFPSSGLMNAMIWGSMGYAAFAKKGLANVKQFYAELWTGLQGLVGRTSSSKGLLSEIVIGKGNGKFLIAGVGALLASMMDSISSIDSLLVGTPLLMMGLLGGDVTGKILKEAVFDKVKNAVSGGFSSGVSASSSQVLSSGKAMVVSFIKAIANAQRNSKGYLSGALDLAALFSLNADGSQNDVIGLMKNFGSNVKTSLQNIKSAFLSSGVGKAAESVFTKVADAISGISLSSIRSKVVAISESIGSIGSKISGKAKAGAAATSGFFSGLFGSASDIGANAVDIAYNFFSALNRGFSKGLAATKREFSLTWSTLMLSAMNLKNMENDIGANIVGTAILGIGTAFSSTITFITSGIQKIKGVLVAMAAAGGATGFIGKALLGVTGKGLILAITGLILSLGSSAVFAADSASDAFSSLGAKLLDIVLNLTKIVAGLYLVHKSFQLFKVYKTLGVEGLKVELLGMLASAKSSTTALANYLKTTFIAIFASIRQGFLVLAMPEFWVSLYGRLAATGDALRSAAGAVGNIGQAARNGFGAASVAASQLMQWLKGLSISGIIAAWLLSAALVGSSGAIVMALGKVGVAIQAVRAGLVMLFMSTAGLVGLGVAAAGGLLGLYFFGPEGSFLDKLEWAKDKIMNLIGISKDSPLAPRQKRINELLPAESFAGIDVSFKSQIQQMDGEKMTPYQFRMLEELSATTGETITRMKELYTKQGELTDVQVKEYTDAIKQQERMFARMPKNDIAPDMVKASADLSKVLLATDTSFSSAVRNVGRALLETTGWMFSGIIETVGEVGTRVFSNLADSAVSAGKTINNMLGGSMAFAGDAVAAIGNSVSGFWTSVFGESAVPEQKKFSPTDDFFKGLSDGLGVVLKGFDDGVAGLMGSVREYAATFRDIAYPPASRDRVAMAAKVDSNAIAINDAKKYLLEPEIADLVQYTSAFERAQKMLDSARKSLMFTETSDEVKALSEAVDLARANYERAVETALNTADFRKQAEEYRNFMSKFWISAKDFLGIQSEDSSLGLELLLSGGEELQFAELANQVENVMRRLKDGPMSVGLSLPLKLEAVNAKRVAKEAQERINAEAFIDSKLEYQIKISGLDIAKEQLYKFYATNAKGYEEWSNNVASLDKKISELKGLSDKSLGKTETDETRQKVASLILEIEKLRETLANSAPKMNWLEQLKADAATLEVPLPDFTKVGARNEDALMQLAKRMRETVQLKASMGKDIELKLPDQVLSDFQALALVLRDINLDLDKMMTPRADASFADWVAHMRDKAGVGFTPKDIENLTRSQIQDRYDIGVYKSQIMPQYDAAISRGDVAAMQDYARQLYELDQLAAKLVPKYFTLNDIVSKTGVPFERMFKVPRSDAQKLFEIAEKIAELDVIQGEQRLGKVPDSYVQELSKRRAALEKERQNILARSPDRSPAEMMQAFNTSGINLDDNRRAKLTSDDIVSFREFESSMAGLLTQYNSKDVTDPAIIAGLLKDMQAKQDAGFEISLKLRDLNEVTSAIQAAFPDLNFSEAVRQSLSPELFAELAEQATRKIRNDRIVSRQDPVTGLNTKQAFDRDFIPSSKAILERVFSELPANARLAEKFKEFAPQDTSLFGYINKNTESKLDEIRTKLQSEIKALKEATTDDTRQVAVDNIVNLKEALRLGIADATISRKDTIAYQAGKSFADTIHSSVNSGMKEVLTGKKSVSEFLKSLVMSFTETVVNTFVDALTKPITGEKGWLHTTFTNLFESFYSSFYKMAGGKETQRPLAGDGASASFGKVLSPDSPDWLKSTQEWFTKTDTKDGGLEAGFSSIVNELKTGFPNVAELINTGLGATFIQGIGGLLGSLDGVFRSIFSVFNTMGTGGGGGVNWLGIGLQVAGMVGGMMSPAAPAAGAASAAGSGANLATMGGGQGLMLSSGPISVSSGFSAQTSMLDKDLFSGVKFSRTMAIGGVIPGPLGSPQPIMGHGGELVLNSQQQRALLNGENGGNTQHITLNIQGDVSRQTRSEVMRLIPQIALGVNAQNKEAGSR